MNMKLKDGVLDSRALEGGGSDLESLARLGQIAVHQAPATGQEVPCHMDRKTRT